jgi:hypothetical protein
MVIGALRAPLRATTHVARWLVWHSIRVSLVEDLEVPRPPAEDVVSKAA